MLADAVEVHSQEITFTSGAVTLAGTLLMPQVARPCPAIVFVHGSGAETREDSRMIADFVAQHGIAALIYDKRGVGHSTGNWQKGAYRHLAEDALAGVTFMMEQPGIDPRRVGLFGFSEGGWVAPLAASRSASVAFLITVSAAGMSPLRQEIYRRHNVVATNPTPFSRWRGHIGASLFIFLLRILPLRLFPGFAGFMGRVMYYRALPAWKKIHQPVLAIWSDGDKVVPSAQSAALIEGTLKAGGNARYTIKRFPSGTHQLWKEHLDESLEESPERYIPGYLETVAEWVDALAQGSQS